MKLENLYHELILDHGTQPRNHHALKDASHTAEGFNPLCGDKLKLYLKLDHKQNTIVTASFEGSGCAISTASASLLTEIILGKTLEEARALFHRFQQAFTSASDFPQDLGKLLALAGVKAFPARVKCATLAWHTLQAAINQNNQKNEASEGSAEELTLKVIV